MSMCVVTCSALTKIAGQSEARVAFLGGSITEMEGYRPLVEKWLTERFPQTKFSFIRAGISSTCSNTGAFRFQRDVVAQGPVDLLLVEFAVNDDQDAHHDADGCVRGWRAFCGNCGDTIRRRER